LFDKFRREHSRPATFESVQQFGRPQPKRAESQRSMVQTIISRLVPCLFPRHSLLLEHRCPADLLQEAAAEAPVKGKILAAFFDRGRLLTVRIHKERLYVAQNRPHFMKSAIVFARIPLVTRDNQRGWRPIERVIVNSEGAGRFRRTNLDLIAKERAKVLASDFELKHLIEVGLLDSHETSLPVPAVFLLAFDWQIERAGDEPARHIIKHIFRLRPETHECDHGLFGPSRNFYSNGIRPIGCMPCQRVFNGAPVPQAESFKIPLNSGFDNSP